MAEKVVQALISVSQKNGIVDFVRFLAEKNIKILSTGGTAKLLLEQGLTVTEVGHYTGFPEIMDGRVKTLHPAIHGGILARRGVDDAVMEKHGIGKIDLVVVNLYPFEQTVSNPECSLTDAIENIDIGGPAMLRAAAKNYADVAVVVDPADYQRVRADMEMNAGVISAELRFDLAVKAFEHTAGYDGAIASYLSLKLESELHSEDFNMPRSLNLQYERRQKMRYGENPHQNARFYVEKNNRIAGISSAVQQQGKALSYNNIADADAAIECVRQFSELAACVIVKHANPCGVAQAESQSEAYQSAYSTDPESAFGGIIAFNTELTEQTASDIVHQQFVEVIVAPKVTDAAKQILSTKPNIRVLEIENWNRHSSAPDSGNLPIFDYKKVSGGLLVQEQDLPLYSKLDIVTKRVPDEAEMLDLIFAMKVAKFVKSNAIVYAADKMTIGIGAGQMSRVNSARIAAIKAEQAGLKVESAVMASDAFFPFRDGLDHAAKVGIKSVIQPGGSLRDDEVIAAADAHDMAMVFTGMRHFRH